MSDRYVAESGVILVTFCKRKPQWPTGFSSTAPRNIGLGRRRRSGSIAILGFQNAAHFRLGPEAAADVDERPSDRTHHVVQEAVRFHVEPDKVAEAMHGKVRDRPYAALPIGPVRLETAKIVATAQANRRPGHGLSIQAIASLQGVFAQLAG